MNYSDNIKAIQQMLNNSLSPSPRLTVDGIMGPKTRAALARYNAAKAHINGGEVGRLMHAAPAAPLANHLPDDQASDPWMAIAEGELGTAEVKGGQHNKRIIEYHATTSLQAKSDEVAWCSSFVNWVMTQAGYVGTRSAAARSWISWGIATKPRHGAIVVVKKKGANKDASTGSTSGFHVGFMVGLTGTHIRILGGNQGDTVKLSNFNLASYEVHGYRWPH